MPLFNSKKPTHNFPPPVGYNTIHSEEKKKRTSITNFFHHPPVINLKRKHQDDVEDLPDQEEQNKRKKTAAAAAAAAAANMKNHMGSMSRLFQRIAVTVNRTTRGSTPRKEPQPEFVDVFQTMQLPTIEWTDGDLGILPHQTQSQQVSSVLQEKLELLSQYTQPQSQLPQPQPQPQPQLQQLLALQEEDDEDSVFCINTTEFLEFPVPPLLPIHVMRRQESTSTSTPPTRLNSLIIVEEEEDSDDESMPSTPFNDSICYDESNNNNKSEQLALTATPFPLSSL
ncbi:hypothetical protein HMPREF1544_02962 [Mucor circinelloides 1006PhL]|uniref:Uncharacterized protein n=1 Tax=Mucor circinelloides f. circinelloides (strain 1006PhL) TaxID=1220926 RepID=S2JIY1_MUCC1|nr:hypothetical protein HMPREF1544_02962 [Mucor circinelloides 1006PhL]